MQKGTSALHPIATTKADFRKRSIISDAIANAGREKEDFSATAEERKQLKEMFPTLSFDEAMAQFVAFDTAARQNPADAVFRLQAMFGGSFTPMQRAERQAFAADIGSVHRVIAQTAPHLPGFNRERLAKIVSDPKFRSTGNHQADLINAHRMDQAQQQLDRSTEALIEARYKAVGPELYAAIERVAVGQHPSYVAAFRENDPIHNWGVAEAIARRELADLAKAKKVGRKTRSSPSPSRVAENSSLDSIISAAISKHM